MANIHDSFLKFEQKITVPKTKKKLLIESRQKLEKKIVSFFKTKPNIIVPKFYIQGSFKMGTMILDKENTYDVDLGVYFLTKPNVEPLTLQKWVLDAVSAQTTGGATHREKCIRVNYKGDFDIDLPVYYKTEKDEHPFLATKKGWQLSDPKELCDWFEKQKDANGQMVRIIKYIKAWAHNRDKKMPSGIAISVWVANNFKPNQRDDIALFETIKVIKSNLFCEIACKNPASPGDDLCSKLYSDLKDNFRVEFKNFLNEADKALNTKDTLEAVNIWKLLMGAKFS